MLLKINYIGIVPEGDMARSCKHKELWYEIRETYKA